MKKAIVLYSAPDPMTGKKVRPKDLIDKYGLRGYKVFLADGHPYTMSNFRNEDVVLLGPRMPWNYVLPDEAKRILQQQDKIVKTRQIAVPAVGRAWKKTMGDINTKMERFLRRV